MDWRIIDQGCYFPSFLSPDSNLRMPLLTPNPRSPWPEPPTEMTHVPGKASPFRIMVIYIGPLPPSAANSWILKRRMPIGGKIHNCVGCWERPFAGRRHGKALWWPLNPTIDMATWIFLKFHMRKKGLTTLIWGLKYGYIEHSLLLSSTGK